MKTHTKRDALIAECAAYARELATMPLNKNLRGLDDLLKRELPNYSRGRSAWNMVWSECRLALAGRPESVAKAYVHARLLAKAGCL